MGRKYSNQIKKSNQINPSLRPHTFLKIDHEIFFIADSRRVLQLSVTSKIMCTEYWLAALVYKLAQERLCC